MQRELQKSCESSTRPTRPWQPASAQPSDSSALGAAGGDVVPATPAYAPRQPTETILYRVVDEHLDQLIGHAADNYERPLPDYVIKELRAYLRCGRFEEGVVRCHCYDCGLDVFVPHSCGSRSICPSCASRRMCNCAAHLVDRVLPNVPIRQYVLTLPYELRLLAAARPAVVTALGRIFVETIFGELRRSVGLTDAQCGAVSFLHRAGDSFNLNPHFHVDALDGVLVEPKGGDGPCHFVAARPPSPEALERLVTRLHRRALRWLTRRGFIDERDYEDRSNETPQPSALEACAQLALASGNLARLPDDGTTASDTAAVTSGLEPKRRGPYTVELGGFNVNAGVRIRADDYVGRERLARYCARPSFALGRLSELEDGRLAYRLRYPRRGATHRLMTPLELMARLASFVPPPRHPLVRYYGALSSHARLRSRVVPRPPDEQPRAANRATRSSCGHRGAEHRAEADVPQPRPTQPAAACPTRTSSAADPTTALPTAVPQPPTAPSCTQHLHPSTPAKQQRLHYYDSAGVELEVLDGINVITVRHLDRLDGGELLARGPRLDWAKLLRRSFSVDALACPRCGGRLRPIADITDQASIQRLVDHLAAPPAPPTPRARAPTALHQSLH